MRASTRPLPATERAVAASIWLFEARAVRSLGSRLPQELAEHAERPRPAPMGRASPPGVPCFIGRAFGNPPGLGQKGHARSHERFELAAHPFRERQRESLLRTIDG